MSARTASVPVIMPPASIIAWPSKDPADLLHYALDCTAWLTDAGLQIASYLLSSSAGLLVDEVALAENVISMQIGGGAPLTTAVVGFLLTMNNGDELEVLVSLPIRAGAANLSPITSGISVIDDAGNRLADDAGNHLIAA